MMKESAIFFSALPPNIATAVSKFDTFLGIE
jgi:hypothetical protein